MISYLVTAIIGVTTLWTIIKHMFPWLAYDVEFFGFIAKSFYKLDAYRKMDPVYTCIRRFVDRATEYNDKVFLWFEDTSFTYGQINKRANQTARALHKIGVQPQESVGMMMINSPDFITTWFGLSKAGAVPCFINSNLKSSTLLHCVRVSQCSKLIISNDESVMLAVRQSYEKLTEMGVTILIAGTPRGFDCQRLFDLADMESDDEPPDDWTKHTTMTSHFCYIFTSGTTGLPKASIVNHRRAWMAALMFHHVGITTQDVVYTSLPLYHGSGSLLGILGSIEQGCSVVIKKKFSVNAFWEDCRKYNVTVIQYIGEIIRYLCNQPQKADDKNHCLRIAFGNGLSPEVWKKFLERFGEEIIVSEFYNSTEGNIGYYNVNGIVGRIGQSSPIYNAICGLSFLKYDFENDCPVRGEDGRCIAVAIGEPGLVIGRIRPKMAYLGYLGNKELTEKKILRDVHKVGDKYFNSGDLVVRHPDYTVSFVDRIGDTYRWKGENVSTYEVANVMACAPSIAEAAVYGVKVPGAEGRAGMITVVLDSSSTHLSCRAVYQHACASLPHYARPFFIRVCTEIELTTTWKQMKTRLDKEGFDLTQTGSDPLYIMDRKNETYSPLTKEIFDAIHNGTKQL